MGAESLWHGGTVTAVQRLPLWIRLPGCAWRAGVIGHIGLTPQSVDAIGGYRMFGKTDAEAGRLFDDAIALQASSRPGGQLLQCRHLSVG